LPRWARPRELAEQFRDAAGVTVGLIAQLTQVAMPLVGQQGGFVADHGRGALVIPS
jgi:hypothetical protein